MLLECIYCPETAEIAREGEIRGYPIKKFLCEFHSLSGEKREYLMAAIEIASEAYDQIPNKHRKRVGDK